MEKRDGTIKARQCTDGRKEQEHLAKEEATSPTVSTDAIFITSVIDAKDDRQVAVVDLPGAILHEDNAEDVIMFMKGRLAELMMMEAPQTYQKYVMIESEQKVLYVKVQKAL